MKQDAVGDKFREVDSGIYTELDTNMATPEFDDETKKQFMADDREAWNSICTILLGIIVVGLCLATFTVWFVSNYG